MHELVLSRDPEADIVLKLDFSAQEWKRVRRKAQQGPPPS